jgi:[acyl-carrier-protein] S-malonyltransferase
MKPAQGRLAADLEATAFSDLRYPLINNWQAREVRSGAEARLGLREQVPNPVRWTETIRLLVSSGVERFIEVGPGAVLSGLVRSIEPSVKAFRFGEAEEWEKLNEALGIF